MDLSRSNPEKTLTGPKGTRMFRQQKDGENQAPIVTRMTSDPPERITSGHRNAFDFSLTPEYGEGTEQKKSY